MIGIPMDIAVASNGDLYVSDLEIGRIVKIPPDGGNPVEVARVSGCRGLYIDQRDFLWIVSTAADQLRRIPPGGTPETVVAGRPFQFPHAVLVDADGTAFISDGYAHAIWKVAPGQPPQTWVSGLPLVNPVGMAWLGEQLLVVDAHARSVFQVDRAGKSGESRAESQEPGITGEGTPDSIRKAESREQRVKSQA
jgi:sugar lactone lactonase YvrE